MTSFFREPETFEALKETRFPGDPQDQEPGDADPHLGAGLLHGPGSLLPGDRACGVPGRAAGSPADPDLRHRPQRDASRWLKARQGVYPENIEAEVSPERLRRFFTKEQATYRINKSIRDLCVFARQNVVVGPALLPPRPDQLPQRADLPHPALQKRVIPTFHYALNPNGFLLLGASETVGSFLSLFERGGLEVPHLRQEGDGAAAVSRLLRRRHADKGGRRSLRSPLILRDGGLADGGRPFVLREYAPAGVLVNDDLDILQFRGQTGRYLAPAPGEPSHNLLKMAREGLLLALRDALNECRRSTAPVTRPGSRSVRGGGPGDRPPGPSRGVARARRALLPRLVRRAQRRGLRSDWRPRPARSAGGTAQRAGCPVAAATPSLGDDRGRGCREPRPRTNAKSIACGRNSPRCATTSSPSSSNRTP